MPFSLKNVLDKAVKISNFNESQPLSIHLFNILCDKRRMLIKHSPAYQKPVAVSRKNLQDA